MFKSFFLGGFECATGYNSRREWIDQVAATQHDRFAEQDYELLRRAGIYAARESVRWPLVDQHGKHDFSSVRPFLRAAQENGVEVIWDLFHYGYPEGVDLFSEEFPRRFADYCYAAARYIAARTDGTCYFTPVNEPSYFSWAAGHAGVFAPYEKERGLELKIALIRAAIQGIDAIRGACPGARIVNVDPICHVAPPLGREDLQPEADDFNHRCVMQSWDMLAGRLYPELGGSPEHLDIVGVNYYWTNQWELNQPGKQIREGDPRYLPLHRLLLRVWERYGHEILITETAHRDDERPVWMRQLARECERTLDAGVPLRGACLYPILGMPEWHDQEEWTRMGLWDLIPHCETGHLERIPYRPMARELQEARRLDHRLHHRLEEQEALDELEAEEREAVAV
ncbi:MAG: glycoside hydrolase [Armatimonadota bacterium]